MQKIINNMSKLSINNDNTNYTNLINYYKTAVFLRNNKLYNYKFLERLLSVIYYYKTTICFDYTSEIYTYCSMTNIKKIHKIEILFNRLNDLLYKNWGKFNIEILEYFILYEA